MKFWFLIIKDKKMFMCIFFHSNPFNICVRWFFLNRNNNNVTKVCEIGRNSLNCKSCLGTLFQGRTVLPYKRKLFCGCIEEHREEMCSESRVLAFRWLFVFKPICIKYLFIYHNGRFLEKHNWLIQYCFDCLAKVF